MVAGRERRRALRLQNHAVSLAGHEVTQHGGLMVTHWRRTAFDCLMTTPQDRALELWAWLSTHRDLSRADLELASGLFQGRPGVATLKHLLTVTRTGAVSHAEVLLHQALNRAGIGGWQAGVRIRLADGRLAVADVLFARARLVIEVDGFAAHSSRRAFVRERARQNQLHLSGYLVLRYTWDELERRPDEVIAQIRAALASRGGIPALEASKAQELLP